MKNRNQIPTLFKSGIGIEVGVNIGKFSETILNNSGLDILYSIDPWKKLDGYTDLLNTTQKDWDDRYEETKERLAKFGDRSKIIRKTSEQAQHDFENGSVDFIYIDADHTYDACKKDLRIWWPKVKKGGMLSGHDYRNAPRDCRVKKAVNEFVDENNLDLKLTQGGNKSWMIYKT